MAAIAALSALNSVLWACLRYSSSFAFSVGKRVKMQEKRVATSAAVEDHSDPHGGADRRSVQAHRKPPDRADRAQ